MKNRLLSVPSSEAVHFTNMIDNGLNYSIRFHKYSISLNLINISHFYFIENNYIVKFQKNFGSK